MIFILVFLSGQARSSSSDSSVLNSAAKTAANILCNVSECEHSGKSALVNKLKRPAGTDTHLTGN